ncbi:MAG: class I SAM-dependent methyltransferase [Candidatus Methylomirabilales bacterium]
MTNINEALETNREDYEVRYSKNELFLRYPADWIIRFHNIFLRKHIPTGRVLDYGCGSGNNSIFFIQQGYETYGTEVAESAISQFKANLHSNHLDTALAERIVITSPDSSRLPFEEGFFDAIVSNQVLHFLPSEEHIKRVCKELSRCLRPGGVVFFTMMAPRNYYITHHLTQIHPGRIYEVTVQPGHRLAGVRHFYYIVRDEEELKSLFSEFECLTVGHFDQSMFDLVSNFHWIFIGKKSSSMPPE